MATYITQALGDNKESKEMAVNAQSIHGISVQLLVPDACHPQQLQQLLLGHLATHHGPAKVNVMQVNNAFLLYARNTISVYNIPG